MLENETAFLKCPRLFLATGAVPEGDRAVRQAPLPEPGAVGDERRGDGEDHDAAAARDAARAAHQTAAVRRVSAAAAAPQFSGVVRATAVRDNRAN